MTISRRFFLKSSGLALVAFGAAPKALVRSVYAADGVGRGLGKKTLVVVFQRGAMDGLNVVAPYGDPVYRKMRPTIALPSPPPAWITTSWPCSASSRTPAGVSATRYSSTLVSVGTPTFIRPTPFLVVRARTRSGRARS